MTVFLRSVTGNKLVNARRISTIGLQPEYEDGKATGRAEVVVMGEAMSDRISAGLFESSALGGEFALRIADSLVLAERAGGGIVELAVVLERFEVVNADLRRQFDDANVGR